MRMFSLIATALSVSLVSPVLARDLVLRGEIRDAVSNKLLESRLYLLGPDRKWHTVRSGAQGGSAVAYDKRRMGVAEIHTSLSAHPFEIRLPPGKYELRAERGKEYFAAEKSVELKSEDVFVTLKLRRWIDMAARGWYSGDTHVHRSLAELPNVVLAEDLNVTFPLVYWVTQAYRPPGDGGRNNASAVPEELIRIDSKHVIWPRNTEYEIFSVDGKSHALGAFFILGHRSIFNKGVPPVRPIGRTARREGGLIELDKHCWPWSMALLPLLDVDLYELSNNHIWRAGFAFKGWGEPPADYMQVERDSEGGLTEWGWIDYGFKNYYAILNCGYRLRPTAGTASGVHPVPLGFGRVYVEQPDGFDYTSWLEGLNRGRSFVTTGPMLFVRIDDHPPGRRWRLDSPRTVEIEAEVHSETRIDRLELVLNGEIVDTLRPEMLRESTGAWSRNFSWKTEITSSGWLVVRAIERRPKGRVRFAHSSPVFFDYKDRPLRPTKAQIEYLISRVRAQIRRSSSVLRAPAIDEYRRALKAFERIAETARGVED